MNDAHEVDDVEGNNYGDKVRNQMDTKDLGAIMGRFFRAVSWRED